MRNLYTLLFLFFFTATFAQTVTLKGKITDNGNFPLESATVYLTSVKDSSIVDYTISNKNGNWELKIKKVAKPVYLKISYVGLKDYKKLLESIAEDRDFGTIVLEDLPNELSEVVIENEIPPIRIKKDTLEFDAASFKVRPDANVETLLKQLPGVEIDEEGKIKVNGKEVSQILVNGKPFFDKDGKIALENLPADIINKVQVSDKKTKLEEYTGKDASGKDATINLTIDEDKNKGYFSRFTLGYGSDKRYEANGLLNYFKGERKISILASSNNINTSGFSMDEIFDSMSGGRNNSIYTSSDGSFGINGLRFGGNRGITRTNIFGITYGDQWFKKFDPNVNYFYTSADTENNSKYRSQVFLPRAENEDANGPVKSNITESASRSDSFKYAHNFSSEFETKIDSTTTLYIAPKFTKANSKNSSSTKSTMVDQDLKLLNEYDGTSHNDTDNNAFSSELTLTKMLNKRGRSVSIEFNSDNKLDDASNYNNSSTLFYEDDGTIRPDIRNQLVKDRQSRDYYKGNFTFNESITDSLSLNVGATYSHETNITNRKGFRFNDATNGFTDVFSELTNYMRGTTTRLTPFTAIQISKKKFNFSTSLGTVILDNNNFGQYMGNLYSVNKNYMLPWANAYANLRLSKSKYIYFNYNFDVEIPTAEQLLPIADLSNPLMTTIGNENLSPNKTHNIYIGMSDYDYATRSGYSMYGGANYYENKVVSFTDIDTSGKQTIKYGNMAETYDLWMGGNWSKQIKTEGASRYSIKLSAWGSHGFDKGITNGLTYEAKRYSIGPKIGFTYEYGELLNISPIYSFDYNETHYTNYDADFTSFFVHKAGIQTTSYWPKHIVFGNDFTYTYNSNLGDGFKKDFFLWNTSLGYTFLNDKMTFRVKVYDVLNQNLGTSRNISPMSITDSQNTVLKRYAMFSLSVKLDSFGKKKNNNEDDNRFWSF